MNNKAVSLIKNFSYTLSSNLITFLISTLVVLIVPKLIGVESYGYWQLYIFYSSYVGFMHFGWNDGIYLRYGGLEYKNLNRGLFFSQFWMLFFFQLLLGILIFVFSMIFIADVDRQFILLMTALCMLIVNVRYMLVYILQGTNRIKEYAQITMMEKIFYCILTLLFLVLGIREFRLLVIADLLGKLAALIYAAYFCKDIVFNKINIFYFNLKEAIKNISVGIKLMFANIASMFIIGVVRFGIERGWDIATFGKVSLTLSISNLMMTFINAVGIIMFPVLRRTNEDTLGEIYSTMRTFLMAPLLFLLIAYYPLKLILTTWLPQFTDSLVYLALLFPMCIYEGKMALLINTYLKTLRKEKLMLSINLISVLLSFVLTVIFILVFKSLNLTIFTIIVLLAFRSTVSEYFLSIILNIHVKKDIILEHSMAVIFIVTSWFLSLWIGAIVYILAYAVYLLIKRKDVLFTIKNLKQFVRAKN